MQPMQQRMCYRSHNCSRFRFPKLKPFLFDNRLSHIVFHALGWVREIHLVQISEKLKGMEEWREWIHPNASAIFILLTSFVEQEACKSVVGGWQLWKSCKAANQETRLWHYHTPSPPLHPSFSPLITLSSDKAMALGSSKVLETKSNIWQLPSPSSAKVRLTSSIWAHTQWMCLAEDFRPVRSHTLESSITL